MWSTHSRRIDPINLSAKPFYQGEPGAMGLSRGSSAVELISITDQIARSLIPRECLRDLTCDPVRGRMACDVNPDKISASQPDDDQAVKQIKANSWNNEQIHGGNVRCVVTQEGAPALGRRSTSLDHVLRDARLSDLEAELEQLAMNARRSADFPRSSAGSARANPHRSSVGLQESEISNASTDGSRLDANARESRAG